ncbi:hypothetical protein [Cellulomonas sp. PhB143]|uniref:hypothetical protein n=1 Tax=Cellulomonas sp. PhB143 TaxID=2485186 RepID=UPI000F4923C5|nr:hypothetical protein [Cellulomonas sp. PhB143]ROS75458.1 hypothetical protein EDF32_1868 [Cellulomonas sp. PhB143]
MQQVVLVAGVDYEFAGVDFRVFTTNRRRFLERRNTAREDLRFVTMDVRTGETEIRDVTFPGGRRTEAVSVTRSHDPVTRASYAAPAGGHPRFRPGQWRVLGVDDVYATVRQIGAAAPGTLAELSFFSHGWMGGPILVNSFDDRSWSFTFPVVGSGTPVTVDLVVPSTARDPDDRDARPRLDFVAPQMDAAGLGLFRAAFAPDAVAWLWGCAFPRVLHRALTAIERAPGFRDSGTDPETVLTLTSPLEADDRAWLVSNLGAALDPSSTATRIVVRFKHLTHLMCRANGAGYAQALADAGNVHVHAAPLGTYAEYDTGGDRLMNVHAGFAAHLRFYRNYLGLASDAEKRRYSVYAPGRTCPPP